MEGWIKLYREILTKPIWLQSTPEQKTILMTILMMVNYEEREWEWKGERFICQPGQMITSLDKITKNAGKGISIQNVRTALQRFEKYEFITNESTNKSRLITICNWEQYQANEDEETENKEPEGMQNPEKNLLVSCLLDTSSEEVKSDFNTSKPTGKKEDITTCNPDNSNEEKETTNKGINKQLTSNQQATNKQLTTNKNYKNNKKDKEDILQSKDCSTSDEKKVEEKPKRKTTTNPKTKKEKPQINPETELFNKSKDAFKARYFRLFKEEYYWQAKDAGNMKRLINALKFQREQKGLSNENIIEVVAAFSSFLNEAVKDEWIVQNFSISVLYSKFNEIIARAKSREIERKKTSKTEIDYAGK